MSAESTQENDGAARRGGVQSVERALQLLETLTTRPDGLGVSELGQATGLAPATIHRLLATLVARGYARQDPDTRRYGLGSGLIRLGNIAGGFIGAWVRPYLAELVEISGETANLAVLEGGYATYVAQVPSRHRVRMFTEVGNRVSPHSNAVGKVLLAYRPRASVERILERHGLPARTRRTITDQRTFLAELDQVAERGYAVDTGEEEEGVGCLAVPVRGPTGAVVAMSVSGPAERLDRFRRERILPHMLRLADDVSAALAGGDGAVGGVATGSP
ncbi:allantoin degradation transcriptional regulator AllR [soil metagenome]